MSFNYQDKAELLRLTCSELGVDVRGSVGYDGFDLEELFDVVVAADDGEAEAS